MSTDERHYAAKAQADQASPDAQILAAKLSWKQLYTAQLSPP